MPHGAPKTTRAQRRLRRLRVVPAPLPAVRSVEETDPYVYFGGGAGAALEFGGSVKSREAV